MTISFKEAFVDPDTDRSLSLDYLKENNFSAKAIISGFNLDDLEYFDKVTGFQANPFYKVHHAEWRKEEQVDEFNSIEEAVYFFNTITYENIIIEFCGKNLFIWHEDIDYYVIFGDKNLIEKIKGEDYGHDYSMRRLFRITKGREQEAYLNFYNKYNVSF